MFPHKVILFAVLCAAPLGGSRADIIQDMIQSSEQGCTTPKYSAGFRTKDIIVGTNVNLSYYRLDYSKASCAESGYFCHEDGYCLNMVFVEGADHKFRLKYDRYVLGVSFGTFNSDGVEIPAMSVTMPQSYCFSPANVRPHPPGPEDESEPCEETYSWDGSVFSLAN